MGETMLMEDVVPRSLPESLPGRDKELVLIGEFLDRAARGGDAMLVTGEPGVGKTALLDAAAERATARGIQVLRASGVEFEADIPFAGLHQLLWPLVEEFEHLLRDSHRGALNVALGFRGGPAPDRLLVCNATLTLARQVSRVRPLLIIVDDLHWLDRATAPVLGFLARRLAGTAAGFLAALRTDAAGFFERAGLAELELRPPPDQPDRRAWHLGQATIEPDEEVAALLERAAHTIVQRGDGVGAVAALIRAAELSPGAGERARRLAGAAYFGASLTGDLRQAEALLADVRLADPDPAASVETAMAASSVLLHGDGEVAAAHRLLLAGIETAHARDISPMATEETFRTYTLVCHFGGRAELWESLDHHLTNSGREFPASLYLNTTLVADPARSPRAALDRLDTEIESLTRMADPAGIVRIAGTSTFVDRLPDCRQALRRVARDELDGGAVSSVIYANTLLAFEAYLTGQWDEAQRLAAAAAELCDARGYRLLRRNADVVRAFLAAGRGEAVAAQSLADEVIRWAVPRGVRHLHTGALYACVLAALAQSDFEAAYRHATKISPAGQLASHEPHALWVMTDLVEAALRTDRVGEASAHVRAMQEAGVAMISSRLALLSGAAAAMIAPDGEAIDAFERALAVRDAERWPFDLARVHLLYGERLRRARETKESRVHLVAAKETFGRLGARTWAERAAVELRATGQTRPRTAQHDREALTPQELEIAMLAATGLSNKQIGHRLFLSHRTVGAHLYRVFPKLGIASRAALRDALLHQPAA
jgi:DNA-binding CsgD family transcriptional regulator